MRTGSSFKSNVMDKDEMYSTKAGFAACLFGTQLLLQNNTLNHLPRESLETEIELMHKRHTLLAPYWDKLYRTAVFSQMTRQEMEKGSIRADSLFSKINRLEEAAFADARRRVEMKQLLRRWECAQHKLLGRLDMYKDNTADAVI